MNNEWEVCPEWIVALLEHLDSEMCRVMWNIYQEEYSSPFSNTGNNFHNDVFEVEAFGWDDDYDQPYNFKCDDIEVRWYKHLGRDTEIKLNKIYDSASILAKLQACYESVRELEERLLVWQVETK